MRSDTASSPLTTIFSTRRAPTHGRTPDISINSYFQDNNLDVRLKMARGRAGFGSDVVLATHRRPFIDDTALDLSPSQRRSEIISGELEDADIMRRASRRHDQKLLSDITTRLDNAPFTHQPVRVTHQNRLPVHVSSTSAVPKRVLVAPPGARYIRASSVPPSFSPAPVQVRYDYEDYYAGPVVRSTAALRPYHYYPRPEYRATPYYDDDLHYKRSFPRTFRAGSEPPRPVASRPYYPHGALSSYSSLAVRNARTHLSKLENELGMRGYDDVLPPPRLPNLMVLSGAPRHLPPPPLAPRSLYPHLIRASTPPPYIHHSPRHPDMLRAIEDRATMEAYRMADPPSASYGSLRTRAAEARTKLDLHRSMLDRYLPVGMGPITDVEYDVETKYDELAARMPSLTPYRSKFVDTSSKVAPYRPASVSRGAADFTASSVRADFRPPVSETRRRAREVLCKAKGDPHYYD